MSGLRSFDRFQRFWGGNGSDFASLKCVNAVFRFLCPQFVDDSPGWGVEAGEQAIREFRPLYGRK